ncbi:hypothetical protein EXIGLDRAFT_834868, partial [Exidia glandulosa HHB12029]
MSRSSRAAEPPDREPKTIDDARDFDWDTLLVAGKRRSPDVKGYLVLSLLKHLSSSPRDFIEWFFTSQIDNVRMRAGLYLSPKGGNSPLPGLLLAMYTRFPTARDAIVAAVDPVVRDVLERESTAAIECRSLSIQPGDISLSALLAKLGRGPDSIPELIGGLMPYTTAWLLHATSADNEYRRKKKRLAARAASTSDEHSDGSHLAAAADDVPSNQTENDAPPSVGADEADGEEFPAEGLRWQQEYPGFSRNPYLAVIFAISILLFVRNRATNALPFLLGTLLSTYGASVRIVTILSRLGASVSYTRLDEFRVQVSVDAVSRAITAIRSTPMWYFIIDNINLYVKRGMQRITSQNFMIHATNAVFVILHSIVPRVAAELATFLELRGRRAGATADDIRPSSADDAHMLEEFEAVVRNILIAYCPGAEHWPARAEMRDQAAASVPAVSPLEPEVTQTFPVGVVDANEGSYKGLLKALELLRERADMSDEDWAKHVHIGAGDYLTSRNIRGVQYLRQFDVSSAAREEAVLPQSQLFHFAMRATDMIHTAHLGDSARDPGSLSRHKDQLKRTYDVNKVDYANGKSLIRHSLIARILDCVMLLLSISSWTALTHWRPSYEEICRVSKLFVETYATVAAAEKAQAAGDDVLAHSIYFIMDALRFCAFESAVSFADAGRILIILKCWVFDFRGARCHNYARECVEILLRWKYELNDALRKMWQSAWFVNVWGKPGRFIASDLYLEHLNYYVKVVHVAAGSGVSIENIMKKGSSCVEALIAIADAMSDFVGHKHVHRRHKEKKFMDDIRLLVWNMQDAKLHRLSSDPLRALPAPPPTRKARQPKGPQAPPLPRSSVDSLFNKGYSTWNGQWDQFLNSTTWDPELGAAGTDTAAANDTAPSSSTELNAEDVAFAGPSDEDAPSCTGFGGIGGGSEFDSGPTEVSADDE